MMKLAEAPVGLLTSSLSIEERSKQLYLLEAGKSKILVTTNLLSRAVDIPTVKLIINFEVPENEFGKADFKSYPYRIGRAGRFGRNKVIVNLVDDVGLTRLQDIANHFHFLVRSLNE